MACSGSLARRWNQETTPPGRKRWNSGYCVRVWFTCSPRILLHACHSAGVQHTLVTGPNAEGRAHVPVPESGSQPPEGGSPSLGRPTGAPTLSLSVQRGARPYPSAWARPRNVPSPPGQCLWPRNLPSSVLKRLTVRSAQPIRTCGQRRAGGRDGEGSEAAGPPAPARPRPLTWVSPPAPQHRALTASSRRGCPAAVKLAACWR